MATETEITTCLKTLAGARLRNAPAVEESALVKNTWLRIMRDIPGDILCTAVDNLINEAEYWPTPAQMRREAAQVKSRNGRADSTPFDAGYVRLMKQQLPDAYWQYHDMLKSHGTIPTDDELYRLEQLSGRIEE